MSLVAVINLHRGPGPLALNSASRAAPSRAAAAARRRPTSSPPPRAAAAARRRAVAGPRPAPHRGRRQQPDAGPRPAAIKRGGNSLTPTHFQSLSRGRWQQPGPLQGRRQQADAGPHPTSLRAVALPRQQPDVGPRPAPVEGCGSSPTQAHVQRPSRAARAARRQTIVTAQAACPQRRAAGHRQWPEPLRHYSSRQGTYNCALLLLLHANCTSSAEMCPAVCHLLRTLRCISSPSHLSKIYGDSSQCWQGFR